MVTYLCMGLIALFLAVMALYKAKMVDENREYFGIQSTTAMRAFWCMIIILIHVPSAYGNPIQNMIGSFAYIGVTFFFMTSGYGLKLGTKAKPDSIKVFWRKRLLSLMIPMILVNVISVIIGVISSGEVNLLRMLHINGWVQWLLICYFVFWLVYRFDFVKEHKDLVISVFLIAFSISVYFINSYFNKITWTMEIYGFIWGMLLAENNEKFRKFAVSGWLTKVIICILMAGVGGVLYLKFKSVFFWGAYLIKIMLGVLILLLILQLVTRIQIGNKLSLFLGAMSYEIYLIHADVFRLIVAIAPGVNSGVFIILTMIVTVFLAILVNKASIVLINRTKKIMFK